MKSLLFQVCAVVGCLVLSSCLFAEEKPAARCFTAVTLGSIDVDPKPADKKDTVVIGLEFGRVADLGVGYFEAEMTQSLALLIDLALTRNLPVTMCTPDAATIKEIEMILASPKNPGKPRHEMQGRRPMTQLSIDWLRHKPK